MSDLHGSIGSFTVFLPWHLQWPTLFTFIGFGMFEFLNTCSPPLTIKYLLLPVVQYTKLIQYFN